MNWTVTFAPLVPLAVIAALAGTCLMALGAFGWMRGRAVVPRAIVIVLLLGALTNPAIEREARRPLKNMVIIVVDESTSQSLGQRRSDTDAALADLVARIGKLDRLDLRIVHTGQDSGGPEGTQLFASVSRARASVPAERLAGVIFISDGQVHDVPRQLPVSGAAGGAPFHALITGDTEEHDRRIEWVQAPRFGIIGQDQDVELRIVDDVVGERGSNGRPAGPRHDVEIIVQKDGELIERFTAEPGEPVRLSVPISHHGDNVFEVSVEEAKGELTTRNNTSVLRIAGIREKLRVLLVSGVPHAGERVWRSLLKSDPAVDLVHFTILRPLEKQDSTPISELALIAFPTRELFELKLNEFDLVIFDRYHRRGVLPVAYYANVARFVHEGGAVLVAAGAEYADETSLYTTALAPILPAAPDGEVIETPFRPAISDVGRRHPITRDLARRGRIAVASNTDAPWSRWFRLVSVSEPESGHVIMTGPDDRPLLIADRIGEGRIALMLSDHAWLWARGYEGGGPHQILLRRLVHWLMKEPELTGEALRLRAEGSHVIVERQTLRPDLGGAVTLEGPGGSEIPLTLTETRPGLWSAKIDANSAGLYRVRHEDKTALVHVGTLDRREMEQVISTTARLAPIAQATNGVIRRLRSTRAQMRVPQVVPVRAGAPAGGRDWLGLRVGSAYEITGIFRFPLLFGLLGLAILIGALTWVWTREAQ